jgi:hypothetical protein
MYALNGLFECRVMESAVRNGTIWFPGGRLTENEFWSKAKPESNPSCCCARAGSLDSFPIPSRRQSHQSTAIVYFSRVQNGNRSLVHRWLSLHGIAFQLGMCKVVVHTGIHHSSSLLFVPSGTNIKIASSRDRPNESCFHVVSRPGCQAAILPGAAASRDGSGQLSLPHGFALLCYWNSCSSSHHRH